MAERLLIPDDIDLDPSMLETYRQAGINPEDVMEMMKDSSIVDPATGEIRFGEILDLIMKNMDNPVMENIVAASQEGWNRRVDSFDVDFTGYDWSSLASTIPQEPTEGWWVIALERCGFVDAQGEIVLDEDASKIPGAQPSFFLNCNHKNLARITEEVHGLPNSQKVLRFIKRAMATPVLGIRAGIPRFLQITAKLSQHREALAGFLDTLPAPFEWAIETPQLASLIGDIVDQQIQSEYTKSMDAAEAAKVRGNHAFNVKDSKTAIEEYTKAIYGAQWQAATLMAGVEGQKAAQRFLAVCYANRAAALLLPGDKLDAAQALKDSQCAESYDEDYAKSYYRQAKAHEALGEVAQAQETLRRALGRPALATDRALLGLLSELDTQLESSRKKVKD
ncbi:hypothetical protein BDY19DRAFT_946046 [Irpex rosettiformis]|uniref:Uncharacterized protein n=1 Tax=Irpex rosettiformis TaxID=378272 RepID=A0ACB8U349_9APHY|nr:hypothetical protein BDY19DRAFT_946046 [Irpex rosettiformis]